MVASVAPRQKGRVGVFRYRKEYSRIGNILLKNVATLDFHEKKTKEHRQRSNESRT